MAWTVAAILREGYNSGGDNISTITTPTANTNGQGSQDNNNMGTPGRSAWYIGQISLDQAGNAFSRRRLNAYVTTSRYSLRNAATLKIDDTQISHCRAELDSHADTCGVNETHGQVAEVSSFSDSMEPLQFILIVKAAIAFEDPESGEAVILIVNQALYFGNQLQHILLNPNQIGSNNVQVDDIPVHLSANSSHSIIVNEENLIIPLNLKGLISYFQVRRPTIVEIENCQHVVLTSEEEWNPYLPNFEDLESKARHQGSKLSIAAINTQCIEYSDPVLKTVHDKANQREIASIKMNAKNLFIKEQDLATKWAIGLTDASDTVKATTQKFIKSSLHSI